MNIPIHQTGFRDQALIWALILSFCLHLIAFIWIPKLKTEQLQHPLTLKVELVPPAQPEPVPAPPTPEPEPAPPPKPEIKPIVKPKPTVKPLLKQEPSPVVEPPSQIQQQVLNEPAPPPVISVAPKSETPPAFTAPPPPPKPVGPTQQDMDAARNQYGNQLARTIAKHKQYPRIAQMRGWQGEAVVDLQLDGNGNVLSSRIHTPSGFDVLDKEALEMVKRASPFPAPPEALRGNSFSILVPVSFRLE